MATVPAPGVVIVGGGHAGFYLGTSLRREGYGEPIRIIADEPWSPYQRPPLSKTFLIDDSEPDSILFAGEDDYASQGIDVVTHTRVESVDLGRQRVELDSGGTVDYDHLVFATGARNRVLGPELPHGVMDLRGMDDALKLRAALRTGPRVVIIGAGFIGLEIASMLADAGVPVDVVEAGSRAMMRVLSSTTSDELVRRHAARGVNVHVGRTVAQFTEHKGHISSVDLDDGRRLEADLVIVCIGVVPNQELAELAGLPTQGGILVDAQLRTADARVSAIGDCAVFPSVLGPGRLVRLESVQNARDHALCVARRITGSASDYESAPWFWSDQTGVRLQIAGLPHGGVETIMKADDAGGFSSYCFDDDRLIGVESIDRPADHMAARRAFTRGSTPTRREVEDPSFALAEWVKASNSLATPP